MKRIINTITGATIWRGRDYLVDGTPGVVEPPLVLLTEVTHDPPTYDEATQRLVRIPDAIDGETYVRGAVEIADLTTEEIAALKAGPAAPSVTPPILSQLAEVFGSLDPAIQRAFAGAFATVRTLIQADQIALARGYIEDLAVPDELEETKAGILAMIS